MARILIVDDDPVNRELIHAYLEGSGYQLDDAESGEEALQRAAREPPDLVLLDVMMPGIDGFETTRRLKEQFDGDFLPIVLLTSLCDSSARLAGLQMGADDFLAKPVDRQELAVRIKNLLTLRAREIALRERNMALVELHRFKDEMSALIVHDLKNPLSVILSNYDFLVDALGAENVAGLEALRDCRSAGQRIVRLLANLLDMTRMEAGKLDLRRTEISSAELIGDVVEPRRFVAKSRKILFDVAASPNATLHVDTDLISRAVENIVDNSLRHTPPDGRIEVVSAADSHHVQLRIGNTGPSIPPEVRPALFEKFGRASSQAGRMNLGLGLYFCRLAAEAHGGSIWVEETKSLPTLFVMELPA